MSLVWFEKTDPIPDNTIVSGSAPSMNSLRIIPEIRNADLPDQI